MTTIDQLVAALLLRPDDETARFILADALLDAGMDSEANATRAADPAGWYGCPFASGILVLLEAPVHQDQVAGHVGAIDRICREAEWYTTDTNIWLENDELIHDGVLVTSLAGDQIHAICGRPHHLRISYWAEDGPMLGPELKTAMIRCADWVMSESHFPLFFDLADMLQVWGRVARSVYEDLEQERANEQLRQEAAMRQKPHHRRRKRKS